MLAMILLLAADPLQDEFKNIAMKEQAQIFSVVKEALVAFKKGDVLAVQGDCVMYDAKSEDRAKYTREFLLKNKGQWREAAQHFSEKDLIEENIVFESPVPDRGMTGQLMFYFGPKVPRPKNAKNSAYPERHAIELWWSGAVMPDANGRIYDPPKKDVKLKWHFFKLVTPYSMTPSYLI